MPGSALTRARAEARAWAKRHLLDFAQLVPHNSTQLYPLVLRVPPHLGDSSPVYWGPVGSDSTCGACGRGSAFSSPGSDSSPWCLMAVDTSTSVFWRLPPFRMSSVLGPAIQPWSSGRLFPWPIEGKVNAGIWLPSGGTPGPGKTSKCGCLWPGKWETHGKPLLHLPGQDTVARSCPQPLPTPAYRPECKTF